MLASCNTKVVELTTKSADVSNAHNTDKPNIILILSDDVGYELMHYTGGESYETPNLDLMAAGGRQYTQCHSTPLCNPSRQEIMTGKHGFRNYTEWGTMDLSQRTFGNILKDAGYSTCISGKWQLDGGDNAIHTFGFDKYCVWQPYDSVAGSPYKDPILFQDNVYLKPPFTTGKYGQDIQFNYAINFIDSAKTPYFLYWTPNLCHEPFSPTPDDSSFATWTNGISDPRYYPSMVKYMDKLVGGLLDKVRGTNTIVIFTGDNGTDPYITSIWRGDTIKGGKGTSTVYGTHVPLIVWGNGASGIDSGLVDFNDFCSTLKSISCCCPHSRKDGVPFYPTHDSVKPYLYFDFYPNPEGAPRRHTVWVMDKEYKKYDSTVQLFYQANRMWNYKQYPLEGRYDYIQNFTPYEQHLDTIFTNVLNYYRWQHK